MDTGNLGTKYESGEAIIRQGDEGECMYVVQSGKVDILEEMDGKEVHISTRGEGEFFGEMSLFERAPRMATVRAHGPTWVITVDKKNLLKRIQEDPALAFRLLEAMSHRIRELSDAVVVLKSR